MGCIVISLIITLIPLGASQEDEQFYRCFYDTSFAATVPINTIIGGIISEQIYKVPHGINFNCLHSLLLFRVVLF